MTIITVNHPAAELTGHLKIKRINNIVDTSVFASGIMVKIEFYLKKEMDYFPVYRYDSLIPDESGKGRYPDGLLRTGLCRSLDRMSIIDKEGFARITRREKLRWEEVEEFTHRQSELPILSDSVRRSGVYLSFDEFINNRPSRKKFRIQRDYLTDVIYIEDSAGKENVTRNVWRYSENNQLFVMSANIFFHLQRINDAFYFYGIKDLNHIEMNLHHNNTSPDEIEHFFPGLGTDVSEFNAFSQTNYKMVRRPFQLDLDSGEIY